MGRVFRRHMTRATRKGVSPLERGSQVHPMGEFQNLLDFPPAPKLNILGRLDPAKSTEAERRGEALFFGKAQCSACHQAPYSADRDNFRDSAWLGSLISPALYNNHIRCEFDEAAMLDLANDIRSLSDFKRNTVELLDRLRKTRHPLILTINGKAELVVQDAGAYQALLDRVEAIEGIQRGLADVKAGRTKPARQVFDRLRRKHGIPR